jgi:hypothetical protein
MKSQLGTVVSGRIKGRNGMFALLCAGTIRLKKVRIESADGGLLNVVGRRKKTTIVISGFNPAIGGGGTMYRLPKKKSS